MTLVEYPPLPPPDWRERLSIWLDARPRVRPFAVMLLVVLLPALGLVGGCVLAVCIVWDELHGIRNV